MELTWYGHNCFRMIERGMASIVTDPYDESIGYAPLKLRADVVTVSYDDLGYNAAAKIRITRLMLSSPGEYEIGGVFITGVASFDASAEVQDRPPSLIFVFDFDGTTLCHLGALAHIPSQSEIEALGAVDVLMVPVGGGGALNSGQSAEVISMIEPRIVVPMHYKTPDCVLKLDPLERFLKEMGIPSVRKHESSSLRISQSGLPDETEIVVLDYKLQ